MTFPPDVTVRAPLPAPVLLMPPPPNVMSLEPVVVIATVPVPVLSRESRSIAEADVILTAPLPDAPAFKFNEVDDTERAAEALFVRPITSPRSVRAPPEVAVNAPELYRRPAPSVSVVFSAPCAITVIAPA